MNNKETLEEAVQKVANSDDFINGALFAYQWIKEKNEEILMENWREGVRFGSEFEKAKEQDKNKYSEEYIAEKLFNHPVMDRIRSSKSDAEARRIILQQLKNK